MKSLLMVAGFLWLMTVTVGAQMPRDVLDALQDEVIEGPAVPAIIKALHEATEFDRDCDQAVKLTVSYSGERGRVTLVLLGRPCMTVTGPAEGVRQLLLDAQGQPT